MKFAWDSWRKFRSRYERLTARSVPANPAKRSSNVRFGWEAAADHLNFFVLYLIAADQEIDVDHGLADVFAFQQALLIEAAFGIALLTMIWIGFRRWLQHRERMARLIAEQTANRAAEYGAHMEQVEERLRMLEQGAGASLHAPPAQSETPPANALPDPISTDGEVHRTA